MLSEQRRALKLAQLSCFLLWGPAAYAQGAAAWVDPPSASPPAAKSQPSPAAESRPESGPASTAPWVEPETARTSEQVPDAPSSTRAASPDGVAAPEPGMNRPPDAGVRTAFVDERHVRREYAARDLAFSYLDHWSAQNRVALSSAASFYGPSVVFHGQKRSTVSVLAEKRRFAERWPDRNYRYRPETTQVACEADGAKCTFWSIFDYSAANPSQGRRSLGLGEHELVVSFANETPVITSETSRVLRRGAVQRH